MSIGFSALTAGILLAGCGLAPMGSAHAQSGNVWDGMYAGVNAGAAHGGACNRWASAGGGADTASVAALISDDCAGSAAVAGVQIGDNFQYGHVFWGLGADIDAWHSSGESTTLSYAGTALPQGNYAFSNRLGPKGMVILGPRLGYAGNQWMPYVRAGAMLPFGGRDNMLYYTPTGGKAYTASFDGGKVFTSAGWVAGAGAEFGLKDAWSLSAEFLHASFGKASGTLAGCSGTAANCAGFSGISFGDAHDASHANIFRIGVSYWFNYWHI